MDSMGSKKVNSKANIKHLQVFRHYRAEVYRFKFASRL